jgi:hypothetical protein
MPAMLTTVRSAMQHIGAIGEFNMNIAGMPPWHASCHFSD